MKTTLIGLLIGIIVGGLGFYFLNTFSKETMTPHENTLAANTALPTQITRSAPQPVTENTPLSFEWEFKDVKKADDPYQYTQVSLLSGGKSHPIGTYQGSCKIVAANEKGLTGEYADTDELSPRVQCWFAGAGDEVGLFKNGPGYSVKVGELQEGIEGGAAFRGNFKATIPL